MIFSKLGWGNS